VKQTEVRLRDRVAATLTAGKYLQAAAETFGASTFSIEQTKKFATRLPTLLFPILRTEFIKTSQRSSFSLLLYVQY
jgi:hypothetical protein